MNLSVELNVNSYSNSADELRRAMDGVPDGANYKITHHQGDRPWESDSYTITFNWTEER